MTKRRRGYLKHYNDAYQGTSMGQIMHDKEYFLGHVFWVILEKCNQENSEKILVPFSYFERILNVTRSKFVRTMIKMQTYFIQISFEIQSNFIQISVPNYLEYQENRGVKRPKNNPKNAPKNAPIKDKRLRCNITDSTKADAEKFSHSRDLDHFVVWWNENCDPLPKVFKLTPKRQSALKQRIAEHRVEDWAIALQYMKSQPFYCGQGERGWKADFDYFIRPDTITKLLEKAANAEPIRVEREVRDEDFLPEVFK